MTEATEVSVKKKSVSKSASARSARLVAVQGQYEVMHRDADAQDVAAHYLRESSNLELHGEKLVEPNLKLLKSIMDGVETRGKELLEVLANVLGDKARKKNEMDLILKAILLCGSYELMAHQDIDTAIIINDYLDITHAFYEPSEAKLVNGVLDKVSKLFRE